MKVWVSRDKPNDGFDGCICMWGRPPFDNMDDGGYWYDTVKEIDIDEDPKNFRKNFGFTPRKGTCKQYDLELTEIKT